MSACVSLSLSAFVIPLCFANLSCYFESMKTTFYRHLLIVRQHFHRQIKRFSLFHYSLFLAVFTTHARLRKIEFRSSERKRQKRSARVIKRIWGKTIKDTNYISGRLIRLWFSGNFPLRMNKKSHRRMSSSHPEYSTFISTQTVFVSILTRVVDMLINVIYWYYEMCKS